jgi:hypothetical protein
VDCGGSVRGGARKVQRPDGKNACPKGRCKKSILLVRLALFYVTVHGFGPNLAVVGPKLDLSFSLQPGRRQAVAGQVVAQFPVYGVRTFTSR